MNTSFFIITIQRCNLYSASGVDHVICSAVCGGAYGAPGVIKI
ncbi:hypothetical protein [Clostridium sp.]|nr:hypothetical protein [Clostridium sp.]